MGIKLLVVAAIALALAWLGNYLVADKAATWFFYDTRFDAYWKAQSESAAESFQEYVTENGFTKREALTDTEWNKKNSNIILFTEPAFLYEERQSNLEDGDEYKKITIENHKRKCPADTASHKIGLMTVKTLVERNGGSVDIKQNALRFFIRISFPQIESSEFGEDI